MGYQFKLYLSNERIARDVGLAEILLAEKLYEIELFLSNLGEVKAHARSYRIARELGSRLTIDDRPRITTIRGNSLHLDEIH